MLYKADSAAQLLEFRIIAQAVSASGSFVLQLIKDIDQRFPGVKDRIREADVKVRRFANIFVNEEDIRILENGRRRVQSKDEVSIIPAIAGG